MPNAIDQRLGKGQMLVINKIGKNGRVAHNHQAIE